MRDHVHDHGEEERPSMAMVDRIAKMFFADLVRNEDEDAYAI